MAQTPPQMQEVEAKAGVTRYTALMSEAVEKLARGEAVEAAANVQRHAFKNTPEEVGNGFVVFCFLGGGLRHFWGATNRHNMSLLDKLATQYVRRWREVNRPKCVISIGG